MNWVVYLRLGGQFRILTYIVVGDFNEVLDKSGEISSHTSEITDTFSKYNEKLYKSQGVDGKEEMDMFF